MYDTILKLSSVIQVTKEPSLMLLDLDNRQPKYKKFMESLHSGDFILIDAGISESRDPLTYDCRMTNISSTEEHKICLGINNISRVLSDIGYYKIIE